VFLKFKNAFLEMIFPVRCVGCGTEGEWFCKGCTDKIQLNKIQHCPVCWRENFNGKVCENCRSELAGVWVAASYRCNPELAAVIKTLKYKFSESLVQNLSEILVTTALPKDYSESQVVVPVPLHRKRQRWRGFNQAELLVRPVAEKLNLPFENMLLRVKNTPQQACLARHERLQNLRGAFAISPKFSPQNKIILLIDDIASTGATLSECAKTLKKAGAREVWGLVIARG